MQLLSFYSTRDFRSLWVALWTLKLLFIKCAAPAKLPTIKCPIHKSQIQRIKNSQWDFLRPIKNFKREFYLFQEINNLSIIYLTRIVSKATSKVVVFQIRCKAPTYDYTFCIVLQFMIRVKLNRVFFPHSFCQARSPDCGFAKW